MSGRSTSAAIHLLAVNGGSSSIKFSLYESGKSLKRKLHGKVERIGLDGTTASLHDLSENKKENVPIEASDHGAAARWLIDQINERFPSQTLKAIGHRVVNGGPSHSEHEVITSEVVDDLRKISPFDPDHLPSEISLINLFRNHFPDLTQVACFDTVFHHDMPRVAQLIPIPRRFEQKGVRRYGFHGLSYAYLLSELGKIVGSTASLGRVILCHLGNGASLAAVRAGQSIDTSMGFSPASGLPMSTRSGDLDPELAWFLTRTEQMTPQEFHNMVNHQSGLLGISETSPDVRDLLAKEESDPRAAEAVQLFCYQIKKGIGAFAAVLEGMDTLVFSAGIGENSPLIRKRVCEGLRFMGVQIDDSRNDSNAEVISTDASPVKVRVIRTDEELMIAQITERLSEKILGEGKRV